MSIVTRKQLSRDLDALLLVDAIPDYCPNGLQVEGCVDIKKVVTGVTASHALIQAAIDAQAEAILVHHGFFWKSESPKIIGAKAKRIAALLSHQINLYAYHLPLDLHPELGNNKCLGDVLHFPVTQKLRVDGLDDLLYIADLPEPLSVDQMRRHLQVKLDREPEVIMAGSHKIARIAWCTGAAQRYIEAGLHVGIDAYISGEVSEATFHSAVENGVHYFAAGHHATERYGVQALGAYVAKRYGIQHQFIDVHNPI